VLDDATWKTRQTSVFAEVGNSWLTDVYGLLMGVTAFMHHDQMCLSTERIIILESVAEVFIALLTKKATGFAPGSGATKDLVRNLTTVLSRQTQKVQRSSRADRNTLRPPSPLSTLVTVVTKEMMMSDIETFGPSISSYIVKTMMRRLQSQMILIVALVRRYIPPPCIRQPQ